MKDYLKTLVKNILASFSLYFVTLLIFSIFYFMICNHGFSDKEIIQIYFSVAVISFYSCFYFISGNSEWDKKSQFIFCLVVILICGYYLFNKTKFAHQNITRDFYYGYTVGLLLLFQKCNQVKEWLLNIKSKTLSLINIVFGTFSFIISTIILSLLCFFVYSGLLDDFTINNLLEKTQDVGYVMSNSIIPIMGIYSIFIICAFIDHALDKMHIAKNIGEKLGLKTREYIIKRFFKK